MNDIRKILLVIAGMLLISKLAFSQDKEVIELSTVLKTFMFNQKNPANWAMGASPLTPQIQWSSTGVETCGTYQSCRNGSARISINGEEIQHLRQRLEPIKWGFFMFSTTLEKFGPEVVSLMPNCDTVECTFDFNEAVQNKGMSIVKVCEAGPGSFRQTAYELKSKDKGLYVVVNKNLGSGGESTFLDIYLHTPQNVRALCTDAKSAE